MTEHIQNEQKTEAEVTDQIARIASKLGKRAETGVITSIENPTEDTVLTNTVYPEGGGDSRTILQKIHKAKDGTHDLEAGVKKRFISIEVDPGDIEGVKTYHGTSNWEGAEKLEPLTRKQTISASAKILSKARGHVAEQEKRVRSFTDL